ncbi:RidA family protein [Pseudonocardia sp. NPDC049154]|uniref:RidA family protein n=1 Tax=Pseudonocardia sp. NPDC049154 TaxID=3155501 RepID=UPI0033CDC1CB
MIRRWPGQAATISGAVAHGGLVHTAGLVAPSVLTGAPGTMAEQVEEVLDLLRCTLEAAGTVPGNVLRVEAYLTDPADLSTWDAGFATVWPTDPPARTTVCLTLAAPGARIEIQAVAVAAGAR